MKLVRFVVLALALGSSALSAASTQTFVGVVTDSMCGLNHAAMKISPEPKCVKACVGDGSRYKYALAIGQKIHLLSDQASPVAFAGKKVVVTGTLYTKTNIIKVDSIAAAK